MAPVAFALSASPFCSTSQLGSSRHLSRCLQVRASPTRPGCFARVRMAIGIIFSTTTGNTSDVADVIKEKLGEKAADPVELDDVSSEAWESYDAILAGAPTWNTGADEQRSGTTWDDFLYDGLTKLNLKGKPVAIFGCGDSVGYSDNFVDAIEEMHDCFEKQGAKMIGYVSSEGYQHDESKSERDGKFIGLPIDNDNEDDMTEERVSKWCDQVLAEM